MAKGRPLHLATRQIGYIQLDGYPIAPGRNPVPKFWLARDTWSFRGRNNHHSSHDAETVRDGGYFVCPFNVCPFNVGRLVMEIYQCRIAQKFGGQTTQFPDHKIPVLMGVIPSRPGNAVSDHTSL